MTPPSAPDDVNAIEGDIEKTRSSMTSTIEELHGKLNPAVLKDQALDQFREAKEAIKADLRAEIEDVKGGLRRELAEAKSEFRDATIGKVEHMVDDAQQTVKDTGSGLLAAMRDNPIPTALVGIGLGWLFVNARARRTGRPKIDNRIASETKGIARHVGEQASSLALTAEDSAQHALDVARDGARTLVDRFGDLEGRAQDRVGAIAHDARDTAAALEGTFERTMTTNPLPLGAIALALGLAAGLAIPATSLENEKIG
ncbi:MAG TPA: DUF3618 domain-containing protein, partial [Polyangiaceae bacterium]